MIVNDAKEADLYYRVDLPGYEKWLLLQIMMSEAEGESVRGKALVGRVVLNRKQNGWGDDIYSIIYAPGQFWTPGMGVRYPNPECELALMWLEWGWDESEGALYFNQDGSGDWVVHEGNHYFYK